MTITAASAEPYGVAVRPHTGEVLVETGQVAVGSGRTTLFPDSAVVLRTVVPRMS